MKKCRSVLQSVQQNWFQRTREKFLVSSHSEGRRRALLLLKHHAYFYFCLNLIVIYLLVISMLLYRIYRNVIISKLAKTSLAYFHCSYHRGIQIGCRVKQCQTLHRKLQRKAFEQLGIELSFDSVGNIEQTISKIYICDKLIF